MRDEEWSEGASEQVEIEGRRWRCRLRRRRRRKRRRRRRMRRRAVRARARDAPRERAAVSLSPRLTSSLLYFPEGSHTTRSPLDRYRSERRLSAPHCTRADSRPLSLVPTHPHNQAAPLRTRSHERGSRRGRDRERERESEAELRLTAGVGMAGRYDDDDDDDVDDDDGDDEAA
jgi:hypothetical protein